MAAPRAERPTPRSLRPAPIDAPRAHRGHLAVLFGTLAAVLSPACSALAPPGPSYSAGAPAPSASYGGAEAPAAELAPRAARRAPRPAAATPQAEARAEEVAPEERPGLGTEFGERRHSAVRRVNFERAAAQPCAGATLHYNDAAGLAAMIDHDLERGAGMTPVRFGPQGEIGIYVADGGERALPAEHVGQRTYVLGQAGQRYSLVLVNHGPRSYEVVASVDGLDVVDGQDARLHKPGYVLGPHARLRIDGFRTSLSEVAAFRFGRVQGSYAARTGSARNVGVVGVALFCERPPVPVYQAPVLLPAPPVNDGEYPDDDEIRRRQQAEPFPGSGFSLPPP
jgi:hypothetical protein